MSDSADNADQEQTHHLSCPEGGDQELSKEEIQFLKELDEGLKDRYTEKDEAFMLVFILDKPISPPVLKVQDDRRYNSNTRHNHGWQKQIGNNNYNDNQRFNNNNRYNNNNNNNKDNNGGNQGGYNNYSQNRNKRYNPY